MLKVIEGFKLPKEFQVKASPSLLAQAIRVYEERGHIGLRQAKTRSEINRTTKKVYKQKGTGGARHGSRRANLFVGGGVVFGPRAERRIITLPSALKIKAKALALSGKEKEKMVVGASGFDKIAKIKEASEFLNKIGAKRATFMLSKENKGALLFLRNLGNAKAILFKNANAFDVFTGGTIVLDGSIFEAKKETKVEKTETVQKTVKKVAKKN
jgi:large subunit ribosomal protein L4